MKKLLSVLLVTVLLATTAFTAFAEGYGDNSANVKDDIDSEFVTSDDYIVKGGCVIIPSFGLGYRHIEFKLNVKEGYYISFYHNGSMIDEDGTITSGDVAKVIDNSNSALCETLTFMVAGDVNGDGVHTVVDVVAINEIITKEKAPASQYYAADYNLDSQITIYDSVKLRADII